MSLRFDVLRAANIARLPEFKDSRGRPAHPEPDGSDWSPAQWLQATVGELGEFANVRKKYERGDLDHEQYAAMAAEELADVQAYLDILARRALDTRDGRPHPTGIDLGQAVIMKWNKVSARVGTDLRIADDGSCHYRETTLVNADYATLEVQVTMAFTGKCCASCMMPQFSTPSGVTCENGHGGAESVDPPGAPQVAPDARYVIVSHRHDGAYWRPDSDGYTRNIAQAGLYTQAEIDRLRIDLEWNAVLPAVEQLENAQRKLSRDLTVLNYTISRLKEHGS